MNFASKFTFPSDEPTTKRVKRILKNKNELRNTHLSEESIFALDTNILTIDFSFLKNGNDDISTGDPIFCSSCKAILNSFSQIYKKDEYFKFSKKEQLSIIEEEKNESTNKIDPPNDEITKARKIFAKDKEKNEEKIAVKKSKKEKLKEKNVFKDEEESKSEVLLRVEESFNFLFNDLNDNEQVWVCEFCNHQNRIMLEMEEVPKKMDMVYILESQGQMEDKSNETSLIFCIDNSGSMSITTEVEGKLDLKHSLTAEEYQMLKPFLEPGSEMLQQLPSQKKNHTYVSRKQCVLGAIESQLNELNLKFPNKKVGLVIFNNEVNVIGDGKKGGLVLAGDKLKNYEKIVDEIKANGKDILSEPLKNSKQSILDRFAKLEETGKTALGPAILASLLLASEGSKGSMVVICTDGLANIGLGRFDEDNNVSEKSNKFYNELEKFAVENDIIVSLITIKGEDCKTELLGKIVDQTNGNLIRVNPADLAKDFSAILKDDIVATNVDLEMRLHKGLKFKNEDPNSLSADGSRLVKKVGNATYNTEIAFQYKIRDEKELQKLGLHLKENSRIPFQSQIYYISKDGNKCLRVITNFQNYSMQKEIAEKEANVMLLHKVAAQKSSNWAQMGNYEISRKYNKNWSNYILANPLFNKNEEETAKNRRLCKEHRKLRGAIGTKVILNNKEKKETYSSSSRSSLEEEIKQKKIVSSNSSDSDSEFKKKSRIIRKNKKKNSNPKIQKKKNSSDTSSSNSDTCQKKKMIPEKNKKEIIDSESDNKNETLKKKPTKPRQVSSSSSSIDEKLERKIKQKIVVTSDSDDSDEDGETVQRRKNKILPIPTSDSDEKTFKKRKDKARPESGSNKEEKSKPRKINEDSDSEQERTILLKRKNKQQKEKEEEDDLFANLSCSAGSMNALELSGDEAECTLHRMKKAFKNK